MPTKNLRWPEGFGFCIYGNGPAFIVAVQRHSVAEKSGLKPGDQILQVDDEEVAKWTSDEIINFVSNSKSPPPSLGVVSRIKDVTLTALSSKHKFFGLTLIGSLPVVITEVEPRSPASYNNLKPQDILIKVDGTYVTSEAQAHHLLEESTRKGTTQVGVISVPVSNQEIAKQEIKKEIVVKRTEGITPGQIKAREFLAQIKKAFGLHPLEIQKIVTSIQDYSLEKNVEKFAAAICSSFQYSCDGLQLMEMLRYFIPIHHKEAYDLHAQKYWKGHQEQNHLKGLLLRGKIEKDGSSAPSSGRCDVAIQHDDGLNSYVEKTRSITILRGNRCFGVTVCGHAPVLVQSVDKGSPADEAGVQDGDSILALNGIDLRSVTHAKAVALIQGSGSMPTLVIQTASGTLAQPVPSSIPYHTGIYSAKSASSGFYTTPPSSYKNPFLQRNIDAVRPRAEHASPAKGIDTLEWPRKFVPDSHVIEGKTFKEQIEILLKPNEARATKSALDEFACHRNVDSLLFNLYPILNGNDVRRCVLWHYILYCLTAHESDHLKTRLMELTNIDLTEVPESQAENINNGSKSSSPTTDQPRSPGKRVRRRQSLRSQTSTENSPTGATEVDVASSYEAKPRNSPTLTPTRRHRRRRTVGNIQFSAAEHAQANACYEENVKKHSHVATGQATTSSDLSTSITDIDNEFYDNQQQLQRRRRRELSGSSRRRRSVGVVSPTDPSASPTIMNEPHFTQTDSTSPGYGNGAKQRPQTEGGALRRDRRRSQRRTVEICTTTTTTEEVTTQRVQQNQQKEACFTFPGEKKNSNKKKQKSESSNGKAETSIPASSVDDAVFDETISGVADKDRLKSPGAAQSCVKTRHGELNDVRGVKHSSSGITSEPGNQPATSNGNHKDGGQTDASLHERRFFQQDQPKSDAAQDNHVDLDELSNMGGMNNFDEQKKKGYLNALKKRLTFSRPPKNTDTDTFLYELSAQFDNEMNLLDDIEFEEEKIERKYGEKWSYLPNSEPLERPPSPDTSIPPPVNSAVSRSKSVPANIIQTEQNTYTCDAVGTATSQPTHSTPPATGDLVQDKPPVERERVRRRRRRNAENGSRRGSTAIGQQDDTPARRTSDPLPGFETADQVTTSSSYQDDKVIYDVPKPVTTQRRAHVNVEKRTRRSRANRTASMVSKRNSTELRMHVWTDNDLNSNQNDFGKVKMRSSSPVEQGTFFDRAKKKNYRVSGISVNMEDIFSEAEEDLHDHSFSSAPCKSPPTPAELMSAPARDLGDPDEVYAPLHEEVLALGLAYDEHEQEEDEYQTPQTSSVGINTVPSYPSGVPPPPPSIPPPPPIIPPLIPVSPPLMFKNTPPTSPVRMSVKRINWEKIEPVDLDNTVWGQLGEDYDTINDVVKYLDLEQHFAMKRANNIKRKTVEPKKDLVTILAHKKAYNTSILLAHLKLTRSQICDCLLVTGQETTRKRMEASHYKQLLLYSPDHEEVDKLKTFNGDISKLNEADLLALKLVNIPGYQLRLKALVFKHSFNEKEEEIRKNLEVIQRASMQLRKSRKLAKILEFVLAMGNYMNRGHIRISKATGFRIQFLAEMDCTKTSDNKLTFLHILARAVTTKFPDVVTFADELKDVKSAARVIYPAVLEDLQDLRKVWLHVRDNLLETASKNKQDRFKIAMETCLVRTNGAIKRLEQLHNATVKEFNKVAQYFGENPKNIGMQHFFKIFEEFTRKFQKSHSEIRKFVKNRPSPAR